MDHVDELPLVGARVLILEDCRDILSLIEAAVAWRQNLVDIARGVGLKLDLTCDQARRLEREAAKWTEEAT